MRTWVAGGSHVLNSLPLAYLGHTSAEQPTRALVNGASPAPTIIEMARPTISVSDRNPQSLLSTSLLTTHWQLNFLLPDIFSEAQTFDQWFNLDGEAAPGDILIQLHKILRPFLLRRYAVPSLARWTQSVVIHLPV